MTKQNGHRGKGSIKLEGRSRRKVRVAILGVGNCASSLVQGVQYYRNAKPGDDVPGIMHVDLGGYHIRDIKFSAAFDIDREKVGKDLSDAIFSGHNNTVKFADVPHLAGAYDTDPYLHDGRARTLEEIFGKYNPQKLHGKAHDLSPAEMQDLLEYVREL